MRKETIVAYFEVLYQHFPLGTHKPRKSSSSIMGLGTGIRSQEPPNMKQDEK